MENKTKICVLCGGEFIGWGNNPQPLKEEGECCEICNARKVLPERIKQLRERLSKKEEEEVVIVKKPKKSLGEAVKEVSGNLNEMGENISKGLKKAFG